MERGSGESRGNFFDKMTQDIAEEIIPADSIEEALDANKFEHLKVTTEERAKKNQKTLAEGKTIVNPTLNVHSVEKARTSAMEAANAIRQEIDNTLKNQQAEVTNNSLFAKAKGLFGKVGGFFKKNFGASTESPNEFPTQRTSTPETSESKAERAKLLTAKEYIDRYFAMYPALQVQFENNSMTPFETFKAEQTKQLEAKLVSHRASLESGSKISQKELDEKINKGIFSQIQNNPLFKKKGSIDLELFDVAPAKTVRVAPPKERTVRIESPATSVEQPAQEEPFKKTGT